jgi:hypothetical protein
MDAKEASKYYDSFNKDALTYGNIMILEEENFEEVAFNSAKDSLILFTSSLSSNNERLIQKM